MRRLTGLAPEVFVLMLHCRRCQSDALLKLERLDGQDHTVYRCRDCGFLFSPPDESAGSAAVPIAPSPLQPDGEAARRRHARVAAIRPRPRPAGRG